MTRKLEQWNMQVNFKFTSMRKMQTSGGRLGVKTPTLIGLSST